MMQRAGFPNASIKLYKDLDAWANNQYKELGATFITLTLRDSLMSGINEGLLQIYDNSLMHTTLTGNEIIQITLKTANQEISYTRVHSIRHFSVTIDKKGDNIITFQLNSYYKTNLKFTRSFSNNAVDSVTEMLNYLYRDKQVLLPAVTPINIRVPKTNWCLGIVEYMQFIRDHGMSVDKASTPLVWEDMTGIHFSDVKTMQEQDYREMIVTDPEFVGTLSNLTEQYVFDFEWQTKANPYMQNPYKNVSFYAHSCMDKRAVQTIIGEGHNSVAISRSGAYYDQVYRDGKEEYTRMLMLAKNDAYATAKTFGDFSIVPGLKLRFYDINNQLKGDFYVDEIIHEISREDSITNIYMFAASEQELQPEVSNENQA